LKIISPVLESWRSSSFTKAPDAKVVRIAKLVGSHDPRAKRPMRVERLADRHRRCAQLPVADRYIVGDRVPSDHLMSALDGYVAAAFADDDRKLGLVVEQVGDSRHVYVVPGPAMHVTCLLKKKGTSGASIPLSAMWSL
jgi:hypothetical protein